MTTDRARRSLLAASAGAVATALSGCMGILDGGGGGGMREPPENADPPEGAITLPTVDAPGSPGDPVTINPPGKTSVVEFFATWCQPCKPQMDRLATVRDRFDPGTVTMVSITQETDHGLIREFWKKHDGAWPAAIDENLYATDRYDVNGLPTTVIVAPDGEWVAYHQGGPISADKLSSEVRKANQRTPTTTEG